MRDVLVMEVGVGYHHPPIQWLNRPMDARQWGNPAAVASRAVAWILRPVFTGARSLISLVVERQRATVHGNSSNVVRAAPPT